MMQMYLGVSTYPTYRTDQGIVGGTAWSNSVEYQTPDISGLTGRAIYAMGNTEDNGDHKYAAQLNYLRGGLAMTAVYRYVNFSTTPGDLTKFMADFKSQSGTQLGVTYDFGIAKVYAQYLYYKNDVASSSFHVNTGQGGFAVPLGVGRVIGSYAYSRDSGGLDQTRRTWTVGYDYQLSKRTDVYALYMDDRITGLSTGNTFGAGMRTRF